MSHLLAIVSTRADISRDCRGASSAPPWTRLPCGGAGWSDSGDLTFLASGRRFVRYLHRRSARQLEQCRSLASRPPGARLAEAVRRTLRCRHAPLVCARGRRGIRRDLVTRSRAVPRPECASAVLLQREGRCRDDDEQPGSTKSFSRSRSRGMGGEHSGGGKDAALEQESTAQTGRLAMAAAKT